MPLFSARDNPLRTVEAYLWLRDGDVVGVTGVPLNHSLWDAAAGSLAHHYGYIDGGIVTPGSYIVPADAGFRCRAIPQAEFEQDWVLVAPVPTYDMTHARRFAFEFSGWKLRTHDRIVSSPNKEMERSMCVYALHAAIAEVDKLEAKVAELAAQLAAVQPA